MSFRKNYFTDFILKSSRYGEFNDPFDLVLSDYYASLSEEDAKEFYDAKPDYINTIDYYNETYMEIQGGAQASTTVLCFSETFSSILMWSHYASSHTGLCIGYDAKCDFFNSKSYCKDSQNIGHLRPVVYTESRPQFNFINDLINNTNGWFVKSPDWSYEKEHRILLPISESKRIEIFHGPKSKPESNFECIWGYVIDPVNIKEGILGCKMEDENKIYIYEALKNYDIEIIEAKIHPLYYKLDFKKYNPRVI